MPTKLYLNYEHFRPRKGNWSLYWNAGYSSEGLGGPSRGALRFDFNPTYFVNDNLSFYGELYAQHNPDWLLWCPVGGGPCAGQGGRDLLGSYRSNLLQLNGGMGDSGLIRSDCRWKPVTWLELANTMRGTPLRRAAS